MKDKATEQVKKEILELKSTVESHSFRKNYGETENMIHQLEVAIRKIESWKRDEVPRYSDMIKNIETYEFNLEDKLEYVLSEAKNYKELGLEKIYNEYIKMFNDRLKEEKEFNSKIYKLLTEELKVSNKIMDAMRSEVRTVKEHVKNLEGQIDSIKLKRKENLEALISSGNLEELIAGGYKDELKTHGLYEDEEED